ncbi:MAG: hypothetical protein MMC23_007640 [Stictis urceolatum]|nr:hypothetical protein [Stictis urceolata]
MNLFSQPILSGHSPGLSLQAFHFAGQYGAALSLIALEGMRTDNRGLLVSYVVVWGFLMQNIAFAVVVPILLFLHLGTSSLIKSRRPHDFLPSDHAEAFTLPLSILIGYVAPTVLMSMSLHHVNFDQKQFFNALWQPFPMWVSILQQVFKRIAAPLLPNGPLLSQCSSLRLAYASAIALAGFTHAIALGLSISALCFPGLFSEVAAAQLHQWAVWVPPIFLKATPLSSLTECGALFLQHDQIVGSAAVLLWAATLAFTEEEASISKRVSLCVTIPVLALVFGPMGAATGLLWLRDEAIMSRLAHDITRKQN